MQKDHDITAELLTARLTAPSSTMPSEILDFSFEARIDSKSEAI